MKVKILIDDEKYESIYKELYELGIEISDDAEYVLMSREQKKYLPVKNQDGERIMIDCADIIFIESYGHKIDVHTTDGVFSSQDRIYMLEEYLDSLHFTRISNSVIISKKYVKNIKPALSMKFIITMSDGTVIDVTRSYYASFKKFFGL